MRAAVPAALLLAACLLAETRARPDGGPRHMLQATPPAAPAAPQQAALTGFIPVMQGILGDPHGAGRVRGLGSAATFPVAMLPSNSGC